MPVPVRISFACMDIWRAVLCDGNPEDLGCQSTIFELKGQSMKLLGYALALALPTTVFADPDPKNWEAVLEEARGQTVYWNAWGGSTTTNDFIAWVGERVSDEYGVTLEHVKLTDTADAVSRVVAEKQAGQDDDGAVDMLWINGANFASMKEADLLFGPFAEDLPNWAVVDGDGKTVQTDFTVPVEGYESPWAMAQVVFMYDTADTGPVGDMNALLDWAANNPGRFTYPQPPDFLGTTFLKQALVDLTVDPGVLAAPVSDETYDQVAEPLWAWLDELTPH
jgi:putative thiamine transport system substrate-binding protein